MLRIQNEVRHWPFPLEASNLGSVMRKAQKWPQYQVEDDKQEVLWWFKKKRQSSCFNSDMVLEMGFAEWRVSHRKGKKTEKQFQGGGNSREQVL